MWMKTTIKIPKKYKPEEREAIAIDVLEKIVERTQKGIDKNGDKFPNYSSSYKKSLNFKIGGKTSRVDLTLSGDMLADMQLLKHKSGEIVIGYENGTESNSKAEGNILGTYGSKIPDRKKARDFLGVREKELSEILDKYPVDDKEERKIRVDLVREIVKGADQISAGVIIDDLQDWDKK